MLVCGLAFDHNQVAHLVILRPFENEVLFRSSADPPLSASAAARWVNKIARRFAPAPLWIAVSGIQWHWLEILATLPIRWVHYDGRPVLTTALSLAQQLNTELQDQVSHAFLRACTERLANLIEMEATRIGEIDDDVPF